MDDQQTEHVTIAGRGFKLGDFKAFGFDVSEHIPEGAEILDAVVHLPLDGDDG